jgi:hypothetical protein
MRNGNAIRFAGAAILALAAQLHAGGFFLQAAKPATAEALKAGAVLAVKAEGCNDPAKTSVTATAEGLVNGQRRSIPLKLLPLSETGSYAITRQWPQEGRWVIHVSAASDVGVAEALAVEGPAALDITHGTAGHLVFTASDIDAMLRK